MNILQNPFFRSLRRTINIKFTSNCAPAYAREVQSSIDPYTSSQMKKIADIYDGSTEQTKELTTVEKYLEPIRSFLQVTPEKVAMSLPYPVVPFFNGRISAYNFPLTIVPKQSAKKLPNSFLVYDMRKTSGSIQKVSYYSQIVDRITICFVFGSSPEAQLGLTAWADLIYASLSSTPSLNVLKINSSQNLNSDSTLSNISQFLTHRSVSSVEDNEKGHDELNSKSSFSNNLGQKINIIQLYVPEKLLTRRLLRTLDPTVQGTKELPLYAYNGRNKKEYQISAHLYDTHLPTVLLHDKLGNIRWHAKGYPTKSAETALNNSISILCKEVN